MKPFLFSVLLVMAFSLSACSQSEPTETETDLVELEVTGDYVGMTVPQAQAQASARNVPFRVTMADGEAFPVTMDYRVGRINAVVENGVVVSYTVEGQEETEAQKKTFDQNSWKTEIAETCTSFFDGCNTCQRVAGSDMAACTRMFCETYEQPRCLDDEANANSASSFGGRNMGYVCEGGESFNIAYDQYVNESGVVRLQPDQVMFEDDQTGTKSVLNRTVAASGEKYEAENGLVFWSRGLSAIVMQDDLNLYENCEEV